jgi:UDPglucose 6-dehydrogenase/GDP-mannose 6-dehydrogenase
MRVSVVGTGYVGLVSGVCLAEKGHTVICVDNDADKVARIARGEVPIHEPGLDALMARQIGRRLQATTDLRGAVEDSELTLIAVGTPFDGHRIDLRYVRQVAREIGEALGGKRDYHAVVVKSTVVPGTTDGVVGPILEESSGRARGAFGLGMNPEFLTEGRAVEDFMHPDRFVLGGADERTLDALEALYAPFPGVPTIRTNNATAEMIKYASNALLATMISFANEIANLGVAIGGIDGAEVLDGVHRSLYLTVPGPDGRPTQAPIARFLEAGCGFGGSCLPKDTSALAAHGAALGRSMPLLEAVLATNREQPGEVVALLRRHFPSLRGVRVAVLGLAFKPDTDDVRESPAFPVMRLLLADGAVVSAHDPVAVPAARAAFAEGAVRYCEDLDDALADTDAIVLVTRWSAYERLPELLRGRDPTPLVVDGRRMLDKRSLPRYEGIGLGRRNHAGEGKETP